MGGTKRVAEAVAEGMGVTDPNDPEVVAEADQRLRTDRCAEEIAGKRYGRPFGELPPHEQMTVWMEAEHLDLRDCPHYKGHRDGVGGCRENEGRACQAELGEPCDKWLACLKEYREE